MKTFDKRRLTGIRPAAARRLFTAVAMAALAVMASSAVRAHDSDPGPAPTPPALAVRAALPPLPAGVAELRFADLFKRPVGPRGLEPSVRLLALAGQPVRVVGHMAAAALPMAGRLVLAPMPVELGDEDEHLADDLPPQAVFVHLTGSAASRTPPHYPGLLALTGTLELGSREEPDGHVSTIRLRLDPAASAACLPESTHR